MYRSVKLHANIKISTYEVISHAAGIYKFYTQSKSVWEMWDVEKCLAEAGVMPAVWSAVFVRSWGRRSPPFTSSSWTCLITRWRPDIWMWSVRRSRTTSTRKWATLVKLLSAALELTHQCVSLPWRLPGDTRTKIGLITFDSTIHFYNLQEGQSQPQMLVVSDIDGKCILPSVQMCSVVSEVSWLSNIPSSDVFLPMPDSLLVNLSECKEVSERATLNALVFRLDS